MRVFSMHTGSRVAKSSNNQGRGPRMYFDPACAIGGPRAKAFCLVFVICLVPPSLVHADVWWQTNWSGGPGQEQWADSTMYLEASDVDGSRVYGDVMIDYPAWVLRGEVESGMIISCLIEGLDGALYAGTSRAGKVFRSTDWGESWDTTGSLVDSSVVFALLQASDSALYAGTGTNCDVYKSTDWGMSWLNTGELISGGDVLCLIEGFDTSVYAATYPGKVFKTTDGGASWDSTGKLDEGSFAVYSILQASDSALYAGTGFGDPRAIFKSVDAGSTWVRMWDAPGGAYCLVEDFDGFLYAATAPCAVYKSTDAGTTWIETAPLDSCLPILSVLQASDSTLYISTMGGHVFKSRNKGDTWDLTGPFSGRSSVRCLTEGSDGHLYATTVIYVYRSSYFDAGYLISSVFDTEDWSTAYGVMNWDDTLQGQSLVMKVRTSVDSLMTGAVPWDSVPPVTKGQDISSLSSVNDGDRYVQYRVELGTSDLDITPVLHEISIFFVPTGVEEISGTWHSELQTALVGSSPNPYCQFTTIHYQVSYRVHTTLAIYDLSGRLVETLVDETQERGLYEVVWDAEDEPSGIYLCHLQAADFTATKKMIRLR